MAEEFLRRIPTWLIGAALVAIAIIVIVQRFILELPVYDGTTGTVLPAGRIHSQDVTDRLQSLQQRLSALENEPSVDVGLLEDRLQQLKHLREYSSVLERDVQTLAERIDHCAYAINHLLNEISAVQMDVISSQVKSDKIPKDATEEEIREAWENTQKRYHDTQKRWSDLEIMEEAREKYGMTTQEMYERSGDEFLRIRLCLGK